MSEFRPPIRASLARLILAIVVAATMFIPAFLIGSVALGTAQVTYSLAAGMLTVTTGDLFSGNETIPVTDVLSAKEVTPHGGRRTAGTALPGYCVGRFQYTDIGAVWQATDCSDRAVLIVRRSGERSLLLTPPDRADFLAKLSAGTDMTISLPSPGRGPLFLLAAIMGPLLVLTGIAIACLMLLGPSKMVYRIEGSVLEVKTMFGKQSWPTRELRVRTYTPARLWRVAGAGMPGYMTGRFREEGKATRVYATSTDNMVLLEGTDRILLSPEDVELFLETLKKAGATVTRQ